MRSVLVHFEYLSQSGLSALSLRTWIQGVLLQVRRSDAKFAVEITSVFLLLLEGQLLMTLLGVTDWLAVRRFVLVFQRLVWVFLVQLWLQLL